MTSLRKSLLLLGLITSLSAGAFANHCVCVTLDKDGCGGCEDSYCGGNVCALRYNPTGPLGWNRMVPGFSISEIAGKTVVSEVVRFSPAENVGLLVGDQVVSIDRLRLPLCVNEARAWQNSSVQHAVVIKRGNKMLSFSIAPIRLGALLERNAAPMLRNASFHSDADNPLPKWSPFLSGLVISVEGNHATVTSVLPGSSASYSGVNAGDEIVSANGKADFREVEGSDHRAEVTLRIAASSGERTVRLTMSSLTEILEVVSGQHAAPASRVGF